MMIKEKRGFTLVETLVILLICVFILGVIINVSIVSKRSLQTGLVITDLQGKVAIGMDRMITELYEAGRSTVTVDASGHSLTAQVPTINSTTGTIYKSDSTINWGEGTNTGYGIRYLVPTAGDTNAGRLIRRVLDETGSPISNTILVSNVTFTGPGSGITLTFTGYDTAGNIDYTQPNSVTINLTVSKTIPQGLSLQASLDSRVTFRN